MTIERTYDDSYPQDVSIPPAGFTEAQRLAWGVCDGVITDDELQHLEKLLRESDEARDQYASIVSIHQSLVEIFNPRSVPDIHGLLPT